MMKCEKCGKEFDEMFWVSGQALDGPRFCTAKCRDAWNDDKSKFDAAKSATHRIDELISLWVDVKYKVEGAKLIHPDHNPEAISDVFNALVREGR